MSKSPGCRSAVGNSGELTSRFVIIANRKLFLSDDHFMSLQQRIALTAPHNMNRRIMRFDHLFCLLAQYFE